MYRIYPNERKRERKQTMNVIFDILRGVVIGVANVIPGVSGGTLAVSMGIYDKFIAAVNNLLKKFKQSVLTLLPLGIGMLIGIFGLAAVIKPLLANYPLPTNFAFIGLILGGLPVIVRRMNVKKAGTAGGFLFVIFFALIIVLPLLTGTGARAVTPSVGMAVLLILIGILASATMVVPGVSGSMVLMLIGFYEPVIGALNSLRTGDMGALFILLPFAVGVVIGIFSISKLIDLLFHKFPDQTYCAILGLVVASPVALIIQNAGAFAAAGVWTYVACVLAFAAGFVIAYFLSKKDA